MLPSTTSASRSDLIRRCLPPARRSSIRLCKSMLDDPRVNFAISAQGREAGLDHLGIRSRTPTSCSRSMRGCGPPAARHRAGRDFLLLRQVGESWIDDPAGIAWRDLSDVRRKHRLRRRHRRDEARIAHAKRSACCVTEAKPAPVSACCRARHDRAPPRCSFSCCGISPRSAAVPGGIMIVTIFRRVWWPNCSAPRFWFNRRWFRDHGGIADQDVTLALLGIPSPPAPCW